MEIVREVAVTVVILACGGAGMGFGLALGLDGAARLLTGRSLRQIVSEDE